MVNLRILALHLALAVLTRTISAAQPHIFYSDLESGPNSGGENDQGAYVTIYGNGFGVNQSSSYVTIGGAKASAYRVWSNQKISFQLGAAATTGDIVVTTAAGRSGSVPFTVRKGNIYFVALNGSDGGAGSIYDPWATVQHSRDAMSPGDITYVRNGVTQSTNDDWSACLVLGGKSGAVGNPLAMVVYPEESASIGNILGTASGGCDSAIRTKGAGEHYWVFSGFNLRGGVEALSIYGVHDWRVIANDMSCPNGDGPSACLGTGLTSNLNVYGNRIQDVGKTGASALYHGVYLGTDSNNIDFGWNTIANVRGCRGLQVYTSSGKDLYNLQIHDNTIHDTQCDGIILATVDPSQPGGVNLWNNVIFNAGKGPNTPERSGAFFCINAQGWTSAGKPGSGTIEVFNNTMFGCGTWANPPYTSANGGVTMNGPNPNKRLRLRNNIIYMTTNEPYILMDDGNGRSCEFSDNCARVYGSNNLFYGYGRAPTNAYITGSLNTDPLFVNAAQNNFHLGAGSPALAAGVLTPQSADADGNSPLQCAGDPIGAFGVACFPSPGEGDNPN